MTACAVSRFPLWRCCAPARRQATAWTLVVVSVLIGMESAHGQIEAAGTRGYGPAWNQSPVRPINLDTIIDGEPIDGPVLIPAGAPCADCLPNPLDDEMTWQIAPDGLIYHSYLAGEKEPRLGTQWVHVDNHGWLMDSTLGARVGVLRYGTRGPANVQGFELDFEGAAMIRQDMEEELDLVSGDYRAGVPLTFGIGRYQMKIAYYHLSSHLGDEYMLKNSAFVRINYSRNVLVWGHSYFLTDWLRLYFEAGWAFDSDGGSEPWEFQFGFDFAPPCATGFRGAPFVAANAHLRQEVGFGGNFVFQAGWAWRGHAGGPLLRIGATYYNGKSPQYEFYDQFEQQIGAGIWYDF